MSLVQNERIKLTATYLNAVAVAIFAVGTFAPVVALVSGAVNPSTVGPTAILASVCVLTSLGLHLVARRSLGNLQS